MERYFAQNAAHFEFGYIRNLSSNMYTLLPIVALNCMLLAEGASAERSQSNIPMDCSPLVLDLNVTTTTWPRLIVFRTIVDVLTSPYNPEWNTGLNRAWLQNTLDDFCPSECLDYTLEYYSQNCNWTDEYAVSKMSLYRDYYCGSNDTGGEYCLVEIMEYLADTTIFFDLFLHCTSTEENIYSSLCMDELEVLLNDLGCCAVNLFNTTTRTPFLYAKAAGLY